MIARQREIRGFGAKVVLILSLAVVLLLCPAGADLLSYVKRPESEFAWKFQNKIEHEAGTVYELRLVSQVWQGIRWEHQVQVYQPKGTTVTSTMLLLNAGGSPDKGNMAFGMQLARLIKAPIAAIYQIPNQPLLGDKREDTLIAETFVRYLDTGDENWPLLFPMAKSVVKAMDALQAFSEQQWGKRVNAFIVTGGSKRGWTSWLTAVADSRVKAIAPMVIDTLNMRKQMPHQLESFGAYSEQIADYTERGLIPMPDTAQANRLWSMVDPFTYSEQLALPKLLINGANDPYWAADALNLYWDGLKGAKWVLYVPNAGHNLEQHHADGSSDLNRALSALAAFTRHQIAGNALPTLRWKHDDHEGQMRLTIEAQPSPRGARLWVAHSATRDFRKARWVEQAIIAAPTEGSAIVGLVSRPKDGYVAFFGEVDYQSDDLPYRLSTQTRIVAGAGK